ncbi:MAG: zf-TFIIB domain-containing protein [Magnetococcales bacterium]|nr:zf-TFIIB domain-containing protein [Magnetococcales bacterium]MBF0157242.1 zf-TFIIB domain-containing protein [Magnetococcales bacterium]
MPLLVCPNCAVGMVVVQRSGIELDACPQCRGVWLDRGELEKLLQPVREATSRAPAGGEASPEHRHTETRAPSPQESWSSPRPDHFGERPHRHNRDLDQRQDAYSGSAYKKKRPESVLESLLDIFD